MQGKPLDVRIKWPNDVYGSGLKLAGVLTHSSYRSRIFRLTVGCGINVSNSQPSTCVDDMLRQQSPSARPINKEVCPRCTKMERLLPSMLSAFRYHVGGGSHQSFK